MSNCKPRALCIKRSPERSRTTVSQPRAATVPHLPSDTTMNSKMTVTRAEDNVKALEAQLAEIQAELDAARQHMSVLKREQSEAQRELKELESPASLSQAALRLFSRRNCQPVCCSQSWAS